MESAFSPREKLLWLSRSFTFTNAVYQAPLTFACLTVVLLSAFTAGVSGMLDSMAGSGARCLWFILFVWSWLAGWSHRDWRRDMLDGGSLPSGSVRLWLGSTLLNACAIGLYLWQMVDMGPHGLRLKYWELHLLVCMLPFYAFVMACCGLHLCIRLRTNPLHNRRRLLS